MKFTADLKTKEQLLQLPTCIGSDMTGVLFDSDNDCMDVVNEMLGLTNISLKWDKESKSFTDQAFFYKLEWLTNFKIIDEDFSIKFGIYDNKLSILDYISVGDNDRFYKGKFELCFLNYKNMEYQLDLIMPNGLMLPSANAQRDSDNRDYTFKSQKQLIKWLRRLIKCKKED